MKKRTIPYLIPVLLGALLTITSCGDSAENAPAAGQGQPQAPSLPVVTLPTQTVTTNTTYPASIEGVVNSAVYAKISGYITEVLVDEGEKVRKGQTLFRLETQSLNQDAAAAEANVNAAQVEVDKLKPLVEKNIISNVQLETAKAQLQQTKSSYNSITANIDYGNIKSPVDGYVGSIRLRTGSLVSPSSQEPLTTVSEISQVYAYFSMNEKEYLDFMQNSEGETVEEKINKFPEVSLLLANGSKYDQKGKIETINSQVNANTGSISFRAIFDNPSRLLTNGNSAKLLIPKTFTDVVVVPKESTYEQQGSIYVYKLDENNKATAAKITTQGEFENLYIIKSGVEKGDRIVAKGVSTLRGATQIQPQETPFDSIAKPLEKTFR
ncbi:MAG: efflux RND transporter periplasmic adaptor subunit [Leeuwenhoekiella sp.]